MLIKYTGDVRLADDFSQCTEVNDALNYGICLPWPYATVDIKNLLEVLPDKCKRDGDYLRVHLDYKVVTQPNHSLMIFGRSAHDGIVMQILETDWWPTLSLLLDPLAARTLEQGRAAARAIAVPRCNYALQPLAAEELAKLRSAEQYIQDNNAKYSTRQDNAYAVLSIEKRRGRLPRQIKPRSKLKPSTRW